jgi:phage-related protein
MKSIPAVVIAASQKLYQSGYMRWFVTLSVPSGPTLRYVNHHVNLTYGGHEYTAFPFAVNAVRHSIGELPAVDITLSNISLVLQPYLRAYNGMRGSMLTCVYANTELLAEDYADTTYTYQIKNVVNELSRVTFTVGAPALLERPVPPDRYGPNVCPFRRYRADPRCAYAGSAITGITLSGTDPVAVEVEDYAWTAADRVFLLGTDDVTPSLDGFWTIAVLDEDHFTLDGTDSSEYAGPYVTGGSAGFADCPRNKYECRRRGNSARFGGQVGCRDDTVRLVARWA